MSSAFKRPALDLVAELRRGKVAAELTDEIHDVLAACMDTGKKGSVTLTLTFEPDEDADMEREPRFKVVDQVGSKTPKRSTKPSIFFVSDDGNLTRTDPHQAAFEPLHEVPGDDTEKADPAGKQATR